MILLYIKVQIFFVVNGFSVNLTVIRLKCRDLAKFTDTLHDDLQKPPTCMCRRKRSQSILL